MRLGVWGWAAVGTLVVLGLAARVVFRVEDHPAQLSQLVASSEPRPKLRLETVATGFQEPVDLQFVPGTPGLAVLLEKQGRARLVRFGQGGAPSESSLLLELPVRSSSELGLLGLAFHPRYLENGRIYLNDNPRDGGPLRTRISEWTLPREQLGVAGQVPSLRRVLLEIEQPFQNHDGGQVAFGPDGYLYIGMGDGGSRADPHDNGQKMSTLLGKMLRIDVDSEPSYAVPPDNPFVGQRDARPEIWALGLRNPWRFSFDPRGRLIAADVGQDRFEEVSWIAKGDNLGWRVREAAHCFAPAEGCASAGFVDPIFEYGRNDGQSITGGHVYTGEKLPWLRDRYVFGDHVSGRLWALALPAQRGEPGQAELLGRFPVQFSAFARDAKGELYALDFARGHIVRLDPT
jgi:glucose/arabinose dehydrogenase